MRRLLYLFIFTNSFLLSAQYDSALIVKKDVAQAGKYKSERFFSVLKKDGEEILHGKYKETLKNQTVVSGYYKEGGKDGEWIYKGLKGFYEQKGSFVDGKKVGLWTFKRRKECYGKEYYNGLGKLDSSFTYTSEDKLIRSYVFNPVTQKGLEIVNYKNGEVKKIISEGETKNISIFYANGQLYNQKEYKGKGLWNVSSFYNENGEEFKESNFKNGEGVLNLFRKSSKNGLNIFKKISYKNGKIQGDYTEYDSKGEIRAKGMMENGSRVGFWRIYSIKKQALVSKNYKNNTEKDLTINTFIELQTPFEPFLSSPKLLEEDKKVMNYKKSKKKLNIVVQKILRNNFRAEELSSYVDSPNGICRILMTFTINKYGEIEIKKIKAPHPMLKAEASRVLKMFPTFIPFVRDGECVRTMYKLPLVFRVE